MSPTHAHIAGIHAVRHFLLHSPERALVLYLARETPVGEAAQVLELAARAGVAVERVATRVLEERVPGVRHQGMVLQAREVRALDERDLETLLRDSAGPPLVLVLDGVLDPHNLGAVLRSSDAAGVTAVVIPKDRAAPLTPVVRKVASGAAEYVPLVSVTNLARSLEKMQALGVWTVGLDEAASTSLYDTDLTGGIAIVLGAEGAGLRRLTREHCDHLVSLPMCGLVESLNVSVTAGVCLYEALRQRRRPPDGGTGKAGRAIAQ
jgi:23S rRNA (guanosine2251-2'-O)-methyltransferase